MGSDGPLTQIPSTKQENAWDRFWFCPESPARPARIRGALCVLTALYFISAWPDISFWYAADGPFSSTHTSGFLRDAGMENDVRWTLSPLFLTERTWVYQGYLVVGIGCAIVVAVGRGGRTAQFLLWAMLVGWANRAMILSGLTETLLSLGLMAVAIAPPGKAWGDPEQQKPHWTARLAMRLLATQITLVAAVTFATMLGGRVWFNGTGAFALAAPWQDRTFGPLVRDLFVNHQSIYQILTHLMVLALPTSLVLAWLPGTSRIGKAILIAWCAVVALVGSHWLYAAIFAVMVTAIGPRYGQRSPQAQTIER